MAPYFITFIKPHFITSIATAIFVVLIVTSNSFQTRAMLMIPTLLFSHATLIIFGIEYDRLKMEEWKEHEKKIIGDAFNNFKAPFAKS